MGFSEVVVLLLVYSGLLIFFLVPFQGQAHSKNYQRKQISVRAIYKDNLIKMISHKKAILALVLLGFTLISIWLGYVGVEWHYNAHSGYPPINMKLTALYSICGVLAYTIALLLFIGYVRTIKLVKGTK